MSAIWMRWGPHLVVLGLLVAAVWFIDHRGYQRAMDDRDKRDLELAKLIDEAVDGWEADLADQLAARVAEQLATVDRIETVDRTIIQPIIERELRDAPALSDPDNGYGLGLRDALNQAIEQSADPVAP